MAIPIDALIQAGVKAHNYGMMMALATLSGAEAEYDLYAGITDPPHEQLVLGWNGTEWAYATPRRWHHDDGTRIVTARELLGDLAGLDDPTRPPRSDHTFER
jgi:hypothetical protein